MCDYHRGTTLHMCIVAERMGNADTVNKTFTRRCGLTNLKFVAYFSPNKKDNGKRKGGTVGHPGGGRGTQYHPASAYM